MRDIDLAWALADAVKDSLKRGERMNAYVALGAGDTDSAIRQFVPAVVRLRVALPANVARALEKWSSVHDDESRSFVVRSRRAGAPGH
ncbi:MAG: hypothetical protein WCE30_26870 [Mycobacterium sp.]